MTVEADAAAAASALTKRFANGVIALDQVELDIERANITALIGNNGSGKTTLLKILSGLLTPDSGSVRLLGRDPARREAPLRARFGYVSQAVALDPELTGRETLNLFSVLYGAPAASRRARVASLGESLGLAEHLPRLVSTYSGGLRQRLHLALGLMHKPELLLLDEPTAALDPPGRAFVWKLLQRLRNDGGTVVVASHDLAEVAQHCQAIALLHKGRILAQGSPREVVEAHATWTLEVEVARWVEDDAGLLQQLTPISRLKNVAARGRQVLASVVERDSVAVQRLKDEVTHRLEGLKETVLGYRLQPPDLASAYFNLTGAAIENTPKQKSMRR